MIPNKKHQIFADEFKLTNGLTEDAIRCYQIAYPNTQKESARVKSYSLLQNVDVKKYIQEYRENIRLERENSAINELKAKDSSNCHQLKRKARLIEYDPKYCDVIVKRMIKLDHTLAVKRNGVDCTNEFKDL